MLLGVLIDCQLCTGVRCSKFGMIEMEVARKETILRARCLFVLQNAQGREMNPIVALKKITKQG